MSDTEYASVLKDTINFSLKDNVGVEPGLLWDTVKTSIRGSTIDYLSRSKKQRKQRIENVEYQIHRACKMRDFTAQTDPPHCSIYVRHVQDLQKELDIIYENLNAPFKKKALAQKYFESNRCTKYYFKQPGKHNDSLKSLTDPNGCAVTDNGQILLRCKQYYQELYRQPYLFRDLKIKEKFLSLVPQNVLSDQGIAMLDKDISIEELHESLSKMKKTSVPGEDGFTVNFYLTYWNLVKDLLFVSFRQAFCTGCLSISQRRGMICLIPKKDKDPTLVASWRPITLLNVDYKMLTKLFALRLAVFLPDLIHPDQKGFVKHHNIHENILDIQALITACENDSTEAMLILLDIHKAFDSISWNFLESVLVQYGFPPSFVLWFRIFYTDKELRILNQGQFSEAILPE